MWGNTVQSADKSTSVAFGTSAGVTSATVRGRSLSALYCSSVLCAFSPNFQLQRIGISNALFPPKTHRRRALDHSPTPQIAYLGTLGTGIEPEDQQRADNLTAALGDQRELPAGACRLQRLHAVQPRMTVVQMA